jgi:hypothetical protein
LAVIILIEATFQSIDIKPAIASQIIWSRRQEPPFLLLSVQERRIQEQTSSFMSSSPKRVPVATLTVYPKPSPIFSKNSVSTSTSNPPRVSSSFSLLTLTPVGECQIALGGPCRGVFCRVRVAFLCDSGGCDIAQKI